MILGDFRDYGIEEILQLEFGFQPKRTKLSYHNETDWKSQFGVEDVGIFHPRTLTAHVRLEPTNLLISRIIHEYFGHGSYCEYARNGKLIVRSEEVLKQLETNLFGRELPDNIRVALILGTETFLDETNYILTVSKENPLFQEYMNLQRKSSQFCRDNFLTYEGFAIWLEEFLLKKLNQEEIWNIRKRDIEDTPFQDFYREFKEFEQDKGLLSLIYQTGFPKLRDKASIERVASEHLNLDELSFLILFGSKSDYGDIDLLAVYRDRQIDDRYNTDNLDVIQIDYEGLRKKLKLFDLSLMEILSTGEVVKGDEVEIEKLKAELSKQKFSKEASTYLREKSLEAFNYAQFCYEKSDPEWLLYSLHNLSYVWSYFLANQGLSRGNKIFSLSEILKLEDSLVLNQIFEYLRKIKREFYIPKDKEVQDFLDKTRPILF